VSSKTNRAQLNQVVTAAKALVTLQAAARKAVPGSLERVRIERSFRATDLDLEEVILDLYGIVSSSDREMIKETDL